MTSLPKTMENADLRETKQIIYHSKGVDESYPKMYFLLNLSYYVKSYGHLCQFLAFFMMPTFQIWQCHVTQEANFKKIYFFLILHLILGKVTKFLVEKLSTSEVISQKPHERGGKHPPSAFRVKEIDRLLSGCQVIIQSINHLIAIVVLSGVFLDSLELSFLFLDVFFQLNLFCHLNL